MHENLESGEGSLESLYRLRVKSLRKKFGFFVEKIIRD